MNNKKIQLSKEFKTQLTKAIFALSFFALIYLIILSLAVLLTALCIAGGILLIAVKPMFITMAIGIGLASLGILILIFLLKFIFKSHKVDRSHLVEIKKDQEPELFMMINEIVTAVGTNFPKKVYLSSEVNASVFYDSSFWSMILPIKKNILIGMGLVNTVTKEELKAILSHEFGHFSQRTMKVGSYVYNINQIIFNMLFDNDSYENLIQRWANVSGYFSFFVSFAVKINEGIQWILRKLYEVVNKNYLGLSREMEFHADEMAASVTGYEPLKKSLLRMTLADNSFNNVLNFYEGKISENIISANIYKDQSAVFNFIAEENNFVISNYLPEISFEEQNRFDKSKLVIKDQWASHPTVEERIKRLEKTGFSAKSNPESLAINIFKNLDSLQKELTNIVFNSISYQIQPEMILTDKFFGKYKQEILSNSFSKKYNGYYDSKNPIIFDLNEVKSFNDNASLNDLFSNEKNDLIYFAIALQNDCETLKGISNKTLSIKTFDYDGIRYKRKNAGKLIVKLQQELEHINGLIKQNDILIYKFFKKEEEHKGNPKELENIYREFFEFDKTFDSKNEIYTNLLNELQFVNFTTPFEQIRANFKSIKITEELLKKEISQLLSDSYVQSEITNEVRAKLEQYISETLEYFGGVSYFDDNLNIFYEAMHNYGYLLSRKYFLMKKKLLTYQVELTTHTIKQTTARPLA